MKFMNLFIKVVWFPKLLQNQMLIGKYIVQQVFQGQVSVVFFINHICFFCFRLYHHQKYIYIHCLIKSYIYILHIYNETLVFIGILYFFLLCFYYVSTFFFCCSFVVLADYPAPPLPKQGGGRFSNAVVPSETEVLMRRAEQIPGPSEYTVTIIFYKFFFYFS